MHNVEHPMFDKHSKSLFEELKQEILESSDVLDASFPLNTIKRLAKESDVSKDMVISREACLLLGKACELLIMDFTVRSNVTALDNRHATTANDIKTASYSRRPFGLFHDFFNQNGKDFPVPPSVPLHPQHAPIKNPVPNHINSTPLMTTFSDTQPLPPFFLNQPPPNPPMVHHAVKRPLLSYSNNTNNSMVPQSYNPHVLLKPNNSVRRLPPPQFASNPSGAPIKNFMELFDITLPSLSSPLHPPPPPPPSHFPTQFAAAENVRHTLNPRENEAISLRNERNNESVPQSSNLFMTPAANPLASPFVVAQSRFLLSEYNPNSLPDFNLPKKKDSNQLDRADNYNTWESIFEEETKPIGDSHISTPKLPLIASPFLAANDHDSITKNQIHKPDLSRIALHDVLSHPSVELFLHHYSTSSPDAPNPPQSRFENPALGLGTFEEISLPSHEARNNENDPSQEKV